LKINNNFVKFTAAAALTIGGLSAINANSTNAAAAHKAEAATMRIRINYVPGYGVNTYTSYDHGHFTGVRAKHGTTWNVLNVATDSKGNKWYQIGQNQWVLARYTVNARRQVKTAKTASHATKAAAVVNLAQRQVGKRYVWGATGPNAFDCSGLTSYVYRKAAGKNITRTTYTQVHQGRRVSMSNLQPGDLLFWGSASAPYHVGIYVGNGQYVHAATPSQGVRKQTLSRYFYPSAARRVL
jgi:cell wall-associated NlpC family hydrolase